MKPVAIIGGGITGLTAAFYFKARGIPFVLFEASHRVGGVIESVLSDGYLAECGPNSILETSPAIAELVSSLGLEARRIYSSPYAKKRYVVRDKKPVAVPCSPMDFITTPLFSFPAKLRILAEPFVPPARGNTEESVSQFVARRLGREFLNYAIDPMVAGIYAGDPRQLSLSQAFPKLHALEQRYRSLFLGQFFGARERKRRGETPKYEAKIFSFDGGLQTLIDALQSRMEGEIKTSTPIRGLESAEGGWLIAFENNGGVKTEKFGAVLLALPSHKIASLEIKSRLAIPVESLAGIYYPPVASVTLGFRRAQVRHPLDGFGMLIPQKEDFSILGAIFSSSLFPNRAPKSDVTIACYLGGARAPELPLQKTPGELVEIATRDLGAILGIKNRATFQHVCVHKKAIPQYNVGFGRFRAFMDEMETKAPGLFVAGHARDGISLGDSIVSGRNAAAKIEAYLNPRGRSSATAQNHSGT